MTTMARGDARALFFSGGTRKREPFTMTLGDQTLDVDIVGLSSGARGTIMSTCMMTVPSDDEDGASSERVDLAKMTPELIIAGVMVSGTDTPMFDAADRDAINNLDASYLDPVIAVISRLSGISKKSATVAEGNSGGTAG